ncbi:MAG TPA: calcium-binding protein [Polyangiaceae bacterium]|nr:calcium-binding protein [Polyangiaceae bacterium]
MKQAFVLVGSCLALFAWGCGSSDSAPDDSTPASGTGGSGQLDSSDTTKSTDPDPSQQDPTKLPGAEAPPGVPPQGCVKGFAGGALQLTLDGKVPSVQLEAKDGKLLANDVACSDAGGHDVDPASVTSLRVNGDAGDNGVSWALGSGDWSGLLAGPERVQLWLGEGKNSLRIIGTDGADHFRHGLRDPDVVLDLTGDGTINVVAENLAALAVELGAGDDRLEDLAPPAAAEGAAPAEEDPTSVPITSLSVALIANGGEGNDWIVGGSGSDNLDGGPGDDVLSGLDGNDSFRASEQLDGADIINGGPGYDELSYELRNEPLTLNLCLSDAALGCSGEQCSCDAPSGEAGENDRIVNVEDVTAGNGDDIINGSDAAESLSGGPGADSLNGGGGSDVLYGQTGVDVLDGGSDGDYCDAREGETASGCEL